MRFRWRRKIYAVGRMLDYRNVEHFFYWSDLPRVLADFGIHCRLILAVTAFTLILLPS